MSYYDNRSMGVHRHIVYRSEQYAPVLFGANMPLCYAAVMLALLIALLWASKKGGRSLSRGYMASLWVAEALGTALLAMLLPQLRETAICFYLVLCLAAVFVLQLIKLCLRD